MKLLADENFPRPAVEALRALGFDLAWVSEQDSGASDEQVLAVCVREGRTLLTFDKDFGELAFHRQSPADCGVILFRVSPQSPEEVAAIASAAIASRESWSGYFSVVTRGRIRMTPLAGKR